jgi:hypothetical protein
MPGEHFVEDDPERSSGEREEQHDERQRAHHGQNDARMVDRIS